MKKYWVLCTAIVLAIFLSACSGADISDVRKDFGESEIYTEDEIESAMDIVLSQFSRNFEGCTMTDLRYDEEYSLEWADGWAEQYDAEEAIVLRSNFDVDSTGGDGSLNPNSTYENWNWILVRSGGAWELKTWGYG